jgi:tRNA-dihydrouridine synthase 3
VLAPLTRGGNLPYRRLCVGFGARVTCSEMILSRGLLKGGAVERAQLRHHEEEPLFGVQISARVPELAVRAASVAVEAGASYVDLNMGCPIDGVVRRGEGAALLEKPRKVEALLTALRSALAVPLTVKIRAGYAEGRENAVAIARLAEACGVDAVTVHGRTREQRYRRPANWEIISEVASSVSLPVIGNGDILHASEARHRLATSGCAAVMAARGALVKPWLWQDLAEGVDRPRHAEERLEAMRRWARLAIAHWGADEHGARRVRQFLEFHVDWWRRYVPEDAERTGENTMQGRAAFAPRDELEAVLLASDEEGIARACRAVLEGLELHAVALEPSSARRDPTAGGWA